MERERIVGFIIGDYCDTEKFKEISNDMIEVADMQGYNIDVFEFNYYDILEVMKEGKYKEVLFDTLDFRYLEELKGYLEYSSFYGIPFSFLNHDFDTKYNPSLVHLMRLICEEI